MHIIEVKLNLSKQLAYKIDYFLAILIATFVMIHIVACVWIFIGETYSYSWITHPTSGIEVFYGYDCNRTLKYITSFYWVVTTLATVGYGDVKGFTWQEYIFNMFVEFIGIAFFSFVMGSINTIFLVDTSTKDNVHNKLEEVDQWLVKLDNSRNSKSLPPNLYEKIKDYIKESLTFDHKKLISGCDFFYLLKPSLRHKLVNDLFKSFIEVDFPYLFVYYYNGTRLQCG